MDRPVVTPSREEDPPPVTEQRRPAGVLLRGDLGSRIRVRPEAIPRLLGEPSGEPVPERDTDPAHRAAPPLPERRRYA